MLELDELFTASALFFVSPACQEWTVPARLSISMAEVSSSTAEETGPARRPRKFRSKDEIIQNNADQELMERVVSGDDSAFASFYRRFSPGLFSMIYQILQDQKESEDVLQEAFVQMWKKASTYDATRSGLFTWAVMISRNKAIDRLRSRQRRIRTVEAAAEEFEAVPPESGEQADDVLGRSEERRRVRSALSKLAEGQREAVDLAFFGGMTQMEISRKLGAPLGTVKARIRRGLLALRDVLGSAS